MWREVSWDEIEEGLSEEEREEVSWKGLYRKSVSRSVPSCESCTCLEGGGSLVSLFNNSL